MTTTPGFRPTHVVPGDGMPAWEAPDPARPTVPLDALPPVRLVERLGDWAHIGCANGWSVWVEWAEIRPARHSAASSARVRPPDAGRAVRRGSGPGSGPPSGTRPPAAAPRPPRPATTSGRRAPASPAV
ncbi:hypothetical protein OHB00_47845 [Streptomyces sp. NBC_00631]